MNLTKNQTVIYNWFKKNKGYIKKGIIAAYNIYQSNEDELVDQNDFIKAINKARIDFKNKYANKIESLIKVNIKDSKGEYIKDININNPFVKNLIKAQEIKSNQRDFKLKEGFMGYPIRNPNNVLVIADLHLPFCKKGYLEHCIAMRDKYNCGTIVLSGDEVDLCGISQWEKDPDGFSAGTEADLAQKELEKWFKIFPKAFVCIGNHTARPFRVARASGIPKKFIKSYEEAWKAPKDWKWAENWEINGVLYTHGTGNSGPNAAIKIATRYRQNTVIGHIHSEAGIQYSASKIDLVWGMQVGGAIDDSSYAAYYAKDQLKKSIVGCGIVLNGKTPIYEAMNL